MHSILLPIRGYSRPCWIKRDHAAFFFNLLPGSFNNNPDRITAVFLKGKQCLIHRRLVWILQDLKSFVKKSELFHLCDAYARLVFLVLLFKIVHRKVEDLQFRVEEESITKGDLEVKMSPILLNRLHEKESACALAEHQANKEKWWHLIASERTRDAT